MKHIIIGAGPAGLQMASFLEDHLILEKGSSVCSFFRKFPRQRGFISINKGRDLRFDWNSFIGDSCSFRDYSEDLYPSADDYLRYAEDFVSRKNLNIRFNYQVTSIEKREDGLFSINGGEYIAEKVFFGIGLVPKQPAMSVHPSITAYTYENMPLDKEVYRDKTVVIVGSGNAALETADYIAPVTFFTSIYGRDALAWHTHYPGHARSKNFTTIDSMFLKANSLLILDDSSKYSKFTDSQAFAFLEEHLRTNENDLSYKIDIVIFCLGFRFDSALVSNMVDLCPVSGFPVLTSHFESTETPGLFFIGSATQAHDYKKGTSAFIHGFRYNCEYLSRYLKGIESVILSREEMIKMVFRQINESSCLFHRFDCFCDVVERLPDGSWKYTKEVPLSSVTSPDAISVCLGYRNIQTDFNLKQPADFFIHPIVRYNKVTVNLPSDPLNVFNVNSWHIEPFRVFIDFLEGNVTEQQVSARYDYIFHNIEELSKKRCQFWK